MTAQDPRLHEEEVRDRWGGTPAYRESQRRTSAYSADDWLREREERESIEDGLAACLIEGLEPNDVRPMELAEAHRRHLDRWFYPCSYDLQVGLAELYVTDARFTAHYDQRVPGLAAYVGDAIVANALAHTS